MDVCLIKLGLQAEYMHVGDIYICKKTQQKVAIYGQKKQYRHQYDVIDA